MTKIKNELKDKPVARRRIATYKRQLKRQQICENFGLSRVRKLEDEFSQYRYGVNAIWPLVRDFNEWCMTYTGN